MVYAILLSTIYSALLASTIPPTITLIFYISIVLYIITHTYWQHKSTTFIYTKQIKHKLFLIKLST